MTPADRFWAKVEKSDGCWLWNASTNGRGYGKLQWGVRGRYALAHRVSVELDFGNPVPPFLIVRHACDTPRCVRPTHLLTGTQLDNARDSRERGRALRGEHHHSARLTSAQVQEVRRLLAAQQTHTSIAACFGVARQTITNISTGVRWTP